MLGEPGAIAAPMNEIVVKPTMRGFRAWKVSDADARTGARTAWTSERAFGTHVWVFGLLRSSPM
jgi:hypothetical protein